VLVLAPAHVCAADQNHHFPRLVARDTEHDAALVFVLLAINNHFRARVRQEILQCQMHVDYSILGR